MPQPKLLDQLQNGDASVLQRAVKEAIRTAGLCKHASGHPFRHRFATPLLEKG